MLMHRPRIWVPLLVLVVGPLVARACSVPVFRYALDRWPADAYEVIVFHRGALKGAEKDLVARLEKAGVAQGGLANLEVRTVDLDDQPDALMQKLWEEQSGAALPWMVVRYPPSVRRDETVWATRLTSQAADRLLDSPVRRAIAKHIRQGETGAWVLLECGDRAKDDAAAELLRTELAKMPQELKLPVLKADDPEDRIEPGPPLRISFALLRVSRRDAAEQALVPMLTHTEEELLDPKFAKEPMAFPVFGRGRAYYALVGKGINAEVIKKTCNDLVGPCTCQVKRQYPGVDLLISTDWTERPKPEKPAEPKAAAVVDTAPARKTVGGGDDEWARAADSRLDSLLLVLGLGLVCTVGAAAAFGRWRKAG